MDLVGRTVERNVSAVRAVVDQPEPRAFALDGRVLARGEVIGYDQLISSIAAKPRPPVRTVDGKREVREREEKRTFVRGHLPRAPRVRVADRDFGGIDLPNDLVDDRIVLVALEL